MTPKGAVCILKHSFVLLFLHEFFQAINFHFTQTSEHQTTGNLRSSTKLFAMMPAASHLSAYPSTTCEKTSRYLLVLVRQMANCFIVFYHLHSKFIHWIIKLLFCMKFLSCCRFPNILKDVVFPDSRIKSKFLHV